MPTTYYLTMSTWPHGRASIRFTAAACFLSLVWIARLPLRRRNPKLCEYPNNPLCSSIPVIHLPSAMIVSQWVISYEWRSEKRTLLFRLGLDHWTPGHCPIPEMGLSIAQIRVCIVPLQSRLDYWVWIYQFPSFSLLSTSIRVNKGYILFGYPQQRQFCVWPRWRKLKATSFSIVTAAGIQLPA